MYLPTQEREEKIKLFKIKVQLLTQQYIIFFIFLLPYSRTVQFFFALS